MVGLVLAPHKYAAVEKFTSTRRITNVVDMNISIPRPTDVLNSTRWWHCLRTLTTKLVRCNNVSHDRLTC